MNSTELLNLPRVAQSLDYTCGAACFTSMFEYYNGYSPGEMQFALELETIHLGYTPIKNILKLASLYGLRAELTESARFQDLFESLSKGDVIFVTWWDEDAGHYSLVKQLKIDEIILMDPWTAKNGYDNQMSIKEFSKLWRLRGSKMVSCRLG